MTQTSPAVDRVVAILNFFAEHPQQAFTLSQILKATKLRRATCHLLLVSLAEHGYLFRNQDKSYVLGPSLLAISRKARDGFSQLDVARQEMRLLSDELDVIVCAQFREGNEIVTNEYTVSVSHLGAPVMGIARTSIHPWGALFLAPLADADIELSLAEAAPPLSRPEKDAEREQIAFAREHGFVFAVHPPAQAARPSIRGAHPQTGDFVTELRPGQRYRLQFLLAPVMDNQGQATFLLAMSGFEGEYDCEQIMQMASRLRQACRRITSFIVGKHALI